MRAVTSQVIQNYKRRMVQRTSETDENNNEVKISSELRKPRIFVDQCFEMKKQLKDFDQQSLTDEIDTLIAGVS